MQEFTPAELARLANYLSNELEPNDIADVEDWIDSCPERRQFVADLVKSRFDLESGAEADLPRLQRRVDAISGSLADLRAHEAFERTDLSVSYTGHRHIEQRSKILPRYFSRTIGYAIGGLVSVALLLTTGWYVTGTNAPRVAKVAMSTYSTGPGERAMITLPDGSTILLSVASRVHVPTNYADGNRTLQLDGAALFTVAPSSDAPFTVVAGPSVTRVLGTRFVVRHYNTDTAATIAVRDGKVSVGSSVLVANEALVMSASGTSGVVPVNATQFGFVKGELAFNYIPLPDAIAELNRWYNADIRLGDPALRAKRLVGVFEAGSLTDLISILELTFDVRVVREGRVLTLYRGH